MLREIAKAQGQEWAKGQHESSARRRSLEEHGLLAAALKRIGDLEARLSRLEQRVADLGNPPRRPPAPKPAPKDAVKPERKKTPWEIEGVSESTYWRKKRKLGQQAPAR